MKLQSFKNLELSAQETNNVKGGKRDVPCMNTNPRVLTSITLPKNLSTLLPKITTTTATVTSVITIGKGTCNIHIEWKKKP